jgi:phosphatidylinositol glycan class W
MFSNGFVAGPRLKAMTSWKEGMRNLAKSFRISVPVLVLGAVRLALTRGVNYQEHVTEYGAHWNFFITLGLIPVFTAVIQLLVPRVNFALVGTAIVVSEFIFSSPTDWSFPLNRLYFGVTFLTTSLRRSPSSRA